MKDQSKTKQALIQELVSLRERIAELQQSESERKKAGEEILSLSKFPSENPNPVLRIAKDGEILYSNKAGLELLVHWNVEIGEKAPKKWCRLIKKTLESAMPGSQEEREEVKNKIFSVAISPVAEAGYVNLYCRDITERRQAESQRDAAIEELRESEERFRLTMDATNDALWDWNIVTDEVYRNPRHAEMLGYVPQEFSSSREEWKKLIHPDDEQRVFDCAEAHLKGETQFIAVEYRLKTKSGDYLWVFGRGKGVAYNDDGKPIRIIGTNTDINERKQTEEKLQVSETKYRDLVENINDIIFSLNKEGRFTYISPVIERVLGYSPVTLIGHSFIEFIYPEDLPLVITAFNNVMAGILRYNEYRVFNKSGDIRWIYSSSRPNYINGNVEGINGVATDITEQKLAAIATADSEERFRELFNCMSSGVAVYEAIDNGGDFIFRDFNPAAEKIEKTSRKDILGKRVSEAFPGVKASGVFEVFQRVWQNGKTEYCPENIYKDERNPGSWRENWVLKLPTGKIVAIYNDITERKWMEEALHDSEHLLKEAQKVAHIGHWELDPKIGNPTWSEEIFYIFGLDPKKNEPSFVDHETHLHPDDWSILKMAVTKASKDGTPFDIQFRILHPSGEIKWMHALGTAIMDANGAVSKLFGTAQDITERKRTEEELRTSRAQLRALARRRQQIREEERGRIAREIHDEMGGGLTGLKLDLSWLLRKMDDADKSEEHVALTDKIHESNALIDQMISTVRRISTDLRPSVLDDLGLIAALDWQLSEFTHHTEIPHEYTTTCEYVSVEKDTAIAVFRIFQEALTNVSRHSGATNVAVVIRDGERCRFDDESLVLEIRDNGRGITREEILNPESLGLLGMKERVMAFGGEISIRGEPGGGTTLILKIPLKQGESS